MAYYPIAAGASYITYPVGPVPDGLTVTASGSTNTKGSYTELIASTTFASTYAVIGFGTGTIASSPQMLADFATGAGGAETVQLPNVMAANPGTMFGCVQLPWAVATSTRIAIRIQANVGSSFDRFSITLQSAGGTPGITTYVNYGSDTADSGGTSIDPGGTAEVKGAYSQMTASTSAIVQSLILMATPGGNTAPNVTIWAIDIATGAAASEVVLIPDVRTLTPNDSTAQVQQSQTYLVYIAASVRIAIRASCNRNDATDRLIDLGLLAGTAPSEPSGGGGGAWAYA